MILIRIAPTPIFWANLTFATVKASLSDFVITYSVVNLKYALYVYIGHTAGDLLSAAAGDTTPDSEQHAYFPVADRRSPGRFEILAAWQPWQPPGIGTSETSGISFWSSRTRMPAFFVFQ